MNCVVLHPNEVELICGNEDGSMITYDLNAKDKPISEKHVCPEVGIKSISMAVNATFLTMANSNGQLFVWDLLKEGDEKDKPQILEAHDDYILRTKISPQITYIASCGADKIAKL